jgi:hypothetical protein
MFSTNHVHRCLPSFIFRVSISSLQQQSSHGSCALEYFHTFNSQMQGCESLLVLGFQVRIHSQQVIQGNLRPAIASPMEGSAQPVILYIYINAKLFEVD